MHLAAEDHLNPVGNHIDMAVKKLNVTGTCFFSQDLTKIPSKKGIFVRSWDLKL